jgi:D-3-phosphoglycerate dehydrogenase / 2-oxoglutarate reductase
VSRILIVDPIAPAGVEVLARQAEVVRAPDSAPETTRSLAADCDGIITRSKLPDDVFDAAPRVRAVAIHGTGIDLVPLQVAARAGGWLIPGALAVVEEAASAPFTAPAGFDELERRRYDDSALIVLRHNPRPAERG